MPAEAVSFALMLAMGPLIGTLISGRTHMTGDAQVLLGGLVMRSLA